MNGTCAFTTLVSLSYDMGIGPAFVMRVSTSSLRIFSRYHDVPTVGCPANGTSVREVKMSMVRVLEGWVGMCRKTISERLNSEAIDCFWA